MLFKTLHRNFLIVDAFSKREFPRKVAINVGAKILRLRDVFESIEAERAKLQDKHAEKDEKNRNVTAVHPERGQYVVMKDQDAFDEEWEDMLDSEIENYPEFNKKLTEEELPEDVTGFEIEALMRLGLMGGPEVWD
jgi:hypothetical protein